MTQVLFRKQLSTEEELDVCQRYFDTKEYRSHIDENQLVIGRYSVLPFYNELEVDLENKNSFLINNFNQHQWITNFDWYNQLSDFTFKTWFSEFDLPDDGTQFVVKGKINSRKHAWNSLMYAPDKKTAIRIASDLRKDSMIGEQGIIFREYEKLVTYEIGINDLPFTNEWRFFIYKNNILAYGYYWSIAERILSNNEIPQQAIDFVQKISDIASKYVNFYVLDIAQKEDGSWILVEINDGQMSGLSEINPEELYKNLFYCLT